MEEKKPKQSEVQQPATPSATPPAQEAKKPDAKKVLLRRVEGTPPVTCVSVEGGDTMRQWYPAVGEHQFEVDVVTAVAAVATGGFVVAPESKVKLK